MVLIFVLGFNIGLTMVRPPEFLPRKPASIPGEPGHKLVNDFEVSALVELGCNSTDDKTISTKTSLVRLKGFLGETGLPAEVVNKTTGFTASVLDADGFFTTDYFQLNPGTN